MTRFVPLGAAAFLLVACDPPPYEEPVAADDGFPSIRINFPNPGLADSDREDMPVCPTFNVVVVHNNFDFSHENYDGDPVSGEGHWHLHIDDPALASPLSAVADPFAAVPRALEPGQHTLYAVLVQNNHLRLPESMVDPETPQDVHAVEILVVVPEMDEDGNSNCVGGGSTGGYPMDTGPADSGDSGR
ncbi:MAG: hypothetical protein GY913_29200 [Proteobacteria bacterium]|nr:hypothetical protein [Pseudomonadota bacterium]MCP4920992.1 hypothetical protein [Pseudomonadota bacterium]